MIAIGAEIPSRHHKAIPGLRGLSALFYAPPLSIASARQAGSNLANNAA